MRNARILIFLALGAALLIVQAGSAAAPFATAMNKVCRSANLRVSNVGVSESLYELDSNEPRLLASDQAKVAALVRLGKAPAGVARPFATYLTLQLAVVGLEKKVVTAAKKVQLATVEKLQAETAALQRKQNVAVRQIGAPACLSAAA